MPVELTTEGGGDPNIQPDPAAQAEARFTNRTQDSSDVQLGMAYLQEHPEQAKGLGIDTQPGEGQVAGPEDPAWLKQWKQNNADMQKNGLPALPVPGEPVTRKQIQDTLAFAMKVGAGGADAEAESEAGPGIFSRVKKLLGMGGEEGAEGAIDAETATDLATNQTDQEQNVVDPETTAAVKQLADKQAAALQSAKVGASVAQEFKRPDLATQVPEAETIAKGKAMGLTLDQLASEPISESDIPAYHAAVSGVLSDETKELQQQAQDLLDRQAKGEDISAEQGPFLNRAAALAEQAPRLGALRTAAGRGLQILDPLKPENLRVSMAGRFAQELQNGTNPQQILEYFAGITDEKVAQEQLGRMADRVEQGGSLSGGLKEYFMNALLSKPRTVIKKGIGDLTSAALAIPERAIAARLPGATVEPGEASAMVYGGIHSLQDALKVAKYAWMTGRSAFDQGAFDQVPQDITSAGTRFEDTATGKAIDLLGDVVRIPSKAILSVNDFSHLMGERMELHAQAWRSATQEAAERGLSGNDAGDYIAQRSADLAASPTSEMTEAATKAANERTFSAPLGPVAEKFNQTLDQLPLGLGRLAFPFRRVPVNIFKYGIGHTPLALVTRTFWRAIQDGGADRDLAIAKLGMGSAVSMLIGHAVQDGLITGGGPLDPKTRKDLMATGWQPYSFHVGDKYVSYDSLEPFATPVGLVSDFMEVMGQLPDAKGVGDAVEHGGTALSVALGRNMSRQSYVQTLVNLSDMIDALRTGEGTPEALQKFAGKELSGIVPSAVQGAAKMEDPVLRDTRGLIDEFRSRVPGFSKSLPPRRDLFGNPINVPPGFMANEVYPFRIATDQHDPVADEILRTNASPGRVPDILPGSGRAPRATDAADNPDVGVPMTPQERDRWQVLRGHDIKDPDFGDLRSALQKTMADPDYKGAANEDKARALQSVISSYGKMATEQLLAENSNLRQRYAERQKYRALAHLGDGDDPAEALASATAGEAP